MLITGAAIVGVLWLTAAATGAVAARTWRHRDDLGGLPLAGLLAAVALWAAADATGAMGVGPNRLFWAKVKWIGGTVTPICWLAFVLEYTGRGHLVTRRTVALASAPMLAGLALAWGYPGTTLIWESHVVRQTYGLTLIDQTNGPVIAPVFVYGYLLTVVGGLAIVEFVVDYDQLYRGQAISLLVGAGIAFVGNVVAFFDFFGGLDLSAFFFAVLSGAVANAFLRYELLEFVPAARRVGEKAVVDTMQDAVVVVDTRGRIVQYNERTVEMVGDVQTTILGTSLGTVFADPPPLDAEAPVDREIGGRTYEIRLSPVSDGKGRRVGTSLVFRDVTERRSDRERLTVLNRVLRHNLRNDINLIEGYTSLLADRLESPEREFASEAAAAATSLGRLGDKARKAEQMMAHGDPRTERLQVATVVAEALRDVGTGSEPVEYDVALDDGLWIDADRRLVAAAVTEAVEAVTRRTESGRVGVEATLEDGSLRLSVDAADVTIPSAEREALHSGEETQLRHASGLSIWLVNWAARTLGGEVTFDGPGTLTVRLPNAGVTTDPDRVDAVEP